MKKNFILLCATALSLAVVSCKKETTGSNDIEGDWKFVEIQASTVSTSQTSFGGTTMKTVTTSNYTTINNAGTLKIDQSQMTGNGMSYGVNTMAHVTIYQNGTVSDTMSFPMVSSLSGFTNTASYVKVGSDSLYFPNGATFMGSVQGSSGPSGTKYRIEQNRLIMTSANSRVVTDPSSGQVSTQQASGNIIFEK